MKFKEVLEQRHSIVRLEKMRPILNRIPEVWGKSLPEPGWDDLLLKLDAFLVNIDPDYEIQQAKEKFGVLRFYATSTKFDAVTHMIIRSIEGSSKYICEYCGAVHGYNKKKVYGRPFAWVKTLCDECAKDAGWQDPSQKK